MLESAVLLINIVKIVLIHSHQSVYFKCDKIDPGRIPHPQGPLRSNLASGALITIEAVLISSEVLYKENPGVDKNKSPQKFIFGYWIFSKNPICRCGVVDFDGFPLGSSKKTDILRSG